MPNGNEENGNGQTVDNGEGVKDYVWQRQKTIPLRKLKEKRKNQIKFNFYIKLNFQEIYIAMVNLQNKGPG